MDALNVLIAIGLIHCSLFFFDTFFKSCSHYPYICFLKNTGLEIQVLRVKWYTTAFNRMIVKWGMDRSRFWLIWFNVGVIISIILLPIALFIIIKMTFDVLSGQSSSGNGSPSLVLEPMFPGVNMPLGEVGYYVVTLAICNVIHELGHAIAAAREDVHLFGLGLLVTFIIPVAYTNISSEQLNSLRLLNKLRIMCAGIWHNIILTVLAVTVLILTTRLCTPFYTVGSGISVKTIASNSPLLGPTGLMVQDTVYKINDCPIKDGDDWYRCILSAVHQFTPGYCVKQRLVQEHDESIPARHVPNGVVNCCGADSEVSGSLCFEYIEGLQTGPLQLPPYSCLPVRTIIEQSQRLCQSNHQCSTYDAHCMKPSLDNTTKIMQIKRRKGKDVLFIGHPVDVYRTISVSDWVPKYSFLRSEPPEILTLLCKYVAVFSAGLAVVNVVPCFCFDGQYIINTLVEDLLRSRIQHQNIRQAVAFTTTCIGTLLLGINIVHIFINKLL